MAWRRCVALFTLVLLSSAGCSLFPCPPRKTEPAPPPVERPSVLVKAFPAYRLVVDKKLEDAPSRLVILHARIGSKEMDKLHFAPANLHLLLPDGSRGRVFDKTRAAILMDRTDIAMWNLKYTLEPGHPPGGILPEFRAKVKAKIRERLMAETEIPPGRSVKGYIVADTTYPLESFENVSLEVVATRDGDALRIRGSYDFAAQEIRPPSQ